jgi:hypothetical protein
MTGFYGRHADKSTHFIVGYWRSGTTHLHNLIGQSEHFGYISPLAVGLPWNILGIVRLFQPLLELALPRDRHVDNVAVTPNSPQELNRPGQHNPPSYSWFILSPTFSVIILNRGVFFQGARKKSPIGNVGILIY